LPFSGPGNFYNNPPNNSIPPTGSPITGTVIPEIKDAFGFSAHFKAASQLDKTFGIGFSAGYTLLQTATNVGRRVDSSALASQAAYAAGSARAYYVSADSLRYTNRYHYLGIGAELYTSFKLFKTVAAKMAVRRRIEFYDREQWVALRCIQRLPVSKECIVFLPAALYNQPVLILRSGRSHSCI
jgi:hypothetical protein